MYKLSKNILAVEIPEGSVDIELKGDTIAYLINTVDDSINTDTIDKVRGIKGNYKLISVTPLSEKEARNVAKRRVINGKWLFIDHYPYDEVGGFIGSGYYQSAVDSFNSLVRCTLGNEKRRLAIIKVINKDIILNY